MFKFPASSACGLVSNLSLHPDFSFELSDSLKSWFNYSINDAPIRKLGTGVRAKWASFPALKEFTVWWAKEKAKSTINQGGECWALGRNRYSGNMCNILDLWEGFLRNGTAIWVLKEQKTKQKSEGSNQLPSHSIYKVNLLLIQLRP